MKINKKIIIAVAASLPIVVAAGAQYRLSAPIPGLEKVGGATPFFSYLEQFIPFLLGATAILAMVMITIGGIQYVISGGNESQRSDAKSRIWHAIGGLTLAAISWIILNTINPDLVKFRLPLTEVRIEAGGSVVNIFEKFPSCINYKKCLIETGTNLQNPHESCQTYREDCNRTAIASGNCAGKGTKKSQLVHVADAQCEYTAVCASERLCGKSKSAPGNPYECELFGGVLGDADADKHKNIICP